MSNEQYLGDGVYVEIERGMVKLTTREGGPPTNTIYLELPTACLLLTYINENIETVGEDDPPLEMEPPVYTRLLTDEEMEVLKNGITYDFDKGEEKK